MRNEKRISDSTALATLLAARSRGTVSRREFLSRATALGMTAGMASTLLEAAGLPSARGRDGKGAAPGGARRASADRRAFLSHGGPVRQRQFHTGSHHDDGSHLRSDEVGHDPLPSDRSANQRGRPSTRCVAELHRQCGSAFGQVRRQALLCRPNQACEVRVQLGLAVLRFLRFGIPILTAARGRLQSHPLHLSRERGSMTTAKTASHLRTRTPRERPRRPRQGTNRIRPELRVGVP